MLEVQGYDEVMEMLEGTDIPGQLAGIVEFVTSYSTRLAATMTPVATGAMQRAWTGFAEGMEGRVFIDPSALNPRSGMPVADYAGYVDRRVGISATVMEHADRMAVSMMGDIEYVNR